jgi:thioredoxin-related protein
MIGCPKTNVMVIKVWIGLFFLCICSAPFLAQVSLKWMKIEDLSDSLKKENRPVLVKIETQWCSVCRMMEQKVFMDKKVQKYLNGRYYLVKLDAEQKTAIRYNDSIYNYVMQSGGRGIHQLAKKLAEQNGKVQYPTITIVENFIVSKRLDGYLPKNEFLFWLKS